MKPKLRIVIGGLAIGGAERHLSYILPALVQRGYEVTVFTLSTKDNLAPLLRQQGVTVCSPNSKFFKNWLPGLRQLCQIAVSMFRLYRNFRRDSKAITHFFLPQAYIIGMVTALLVRHHGPLIMSRRSLNHYQQKYLFIDRFEKFLHSKTDFILANSQGVMRDLKESEGVSIAKLGLIYNGIEIPALISIEAEHQLRCELGISTTGLILIIVANLIPYKGHKDLINALGTIKDQMPSDWQLLIVGQDSQGIQAQLQNLASKLIINQHIKWLGTRCDVPALLAIADIGIVASHEEGFSNALLESMSAALAMVVTDVGGNPEAVLDLQSGLVVPSRNPAALAAAILKLALDQNLRCNLAANAQQRIAEHFTLSACVDRYEQVYQAIGQHKIPLHNHHLEIEPYKS